MFINLKYFLLYLKVNFFTIFLFLALNFAPSPVFGKISQMTFFQKCCRNWTSRMDAIEISWWINFADFLRSVQNPQNPRHLIPAKVNPNSCFSSYFSAISVERHHAYQSSLTIFFPNFGSRLPNLSILTSKIQNSPIYTKFGI